MAISTDNLTPTMAPEGIGPDGVPSLTHASVIDPPESFGNGRNPKMATAFQGLLVDTQAVMQETAKTMREMGILSQRLNAMMGGKGGTAGVVNSIDVNNSLSDAARAAHTGLAYGSGLGIAGVGGAGYAVALQAPAPILMGTAGAAASFVPSGAQTSATSVNNRTGTPPSGDSSPSIPAPTPNTSSNSGGDLSKQVKKMQHLQEAQLLEDTEEEKAAAATIRHTGIKEGVQKGQSLSGIASHIKTLDAQHKIPGLLRRSDFLFGGEKGIENEGGLVGRLASGDSVTTAITGAIGGDAIMDVAGPVGIVAGAGFAAYKFGGSWLTGQRAQNATFQSMEGGSNLAAINERVHQAGFENASWGTFSSGQADQIFQGVTAMGLRGAQRTGGTDFVLGNYRQMGMSPEDSLQWLQAAVAAGSNAFQHLGNAINDVTNSAAAASVNTESARQAMFQNYVGLTGTGMTSDAAAQVAAGTQNMINKLGFEGQGITSLPFGDVNMQIAASGVTPGRFYQLTTTGSAASQAYWKSKFEQRSMNLLFSTDAGYGGGAHGVYATWAAEAKAHGGHLTGAEMSTAGPGWSQLESQGLTPPMILEQMREYTGNSHLSQHAAMILFQAVQAGEIKPQQANAREAYNLAHPHTQGGGGSWFSGLPGFIKWPAMGVEGAMGLANWAQGEAIGGVSNFAGGLLGNWAKTPVHDALDVIEDTMIPTPRNIAHLISDAHLGGVAHRGWHDAASLADRGRHDVASVGHDIASAGTSLWHGLFGGGGPSGPPHPANTRARATNRHDNAPDNRGRNRAQSVTGGSSTGGTLRITADPILNKLFKIVQDGVPTDALQVMGNPTSPMRH